MTTGVRATLVPLRPVVSMGLIDSIKQAFDEIESTSRRPQQKSAVVVHILMKKRVEALLLKEQIDAGEMSFADAARMHSSCPSAGKGGSLGQFGPGQMVPAFDALVFAPETQLGELNVCSTQFGTHLVKVLERTGVETVAPAAAAEDAAAEAAIDDPIRAVAEAAAAEVAAAEAAAAEAAVADVAAAEVASAGEMMEVVCPAGLDALDRTIRIALPDAREFDVVVPAGIVAGEAFLVGPFPSS